MGVLRYAGVHPRPTPEGCTLGFAEGDARLGCRPGRWVLVWPAEVNTSSFAARDAYFGCREGRR
eukprot:1158192-Pelagomonas_calceolata.AAC.1